MKRGPKPKPLADRFWPKVNKNGPISRKRPDLGRCWIWLGRRARGYGYFWIARKPDGKHHSIPAHRVSYEWLKGPIAEGLEADHLCRVRHCVNPDHIEPVTRRENIMRGANFCAAKARKVRCKFGHWFTEANTIIRKDGRRSCRKCGRRINSEYAKRKAARCA